MVLKVVFVVVALLTGTVALFEGVVARVAAAVSRAEAGASGWNALYGAHNDLLIGLLIAACCALFSAVLRRLPSS